MNGSAELILLGAAIVAMVLALAGVGSRIDVFLWIAILLVAVVMLSMSGALR